MIQPSVISIQIGVSKFNWTQNVTISNCYTLNALNYYTLNFYMLVRDLTTTLNNFKILAFIILNRLLIL